MVSFQVFCDAHEPTPSELLKTWFQKSFDQNRHNLKFYKMFLGHGWGIPMESIQLLCWISWARTNARCKLIFEARKSLTECSIFLGVAIMNFECLLTFPSALHSRLPTSFSVQYFSMALLMTSSVFRPFLKLCFWALLLWHAANKRSAQRSCHWVKYKLILAVPWVS